MQMSYKMKNDSKDIKNDFDSILLKSMLPEIKLQFVFLDFDFQLL